MKLQHQDVVIATLSSVFVALNLIPAHVPRLYPSRRDRDVAKKEDHVGIN